MENLFKWFTIPNERLALVQISWFVDRFEESEFVGVDKLLCLFLRYCADLDIPAMKQYLEAFMKTEGKKLVKKYNIRLDTMDNYNYNEPASLEEAFRIITTAVFATYDSYCEQDLVNRSFKVDVKAFMEERKVEKMQLLLANTFPSLTNGDDVDEIMSEVQFEIEKIQNVYDNSHLDKLDFMSGSVETKRGTAQQRKLFDTGLPCIDGDTGGTYSQQVWALTLPPGGGKTRMSMAYFAYRAIVSGLGVLYDELELSKMEVENMIIAHHIVHLYGGNVKIPDSEMNRGKLSPEQRRYYEAAKMDLFESGKYGKLVIRTDDLVIETLEKSMFSFLRHNRDIQYWIVDYAGLVKSKPVGKFVKHLDKYEIIDEAYKIAKEIAKVADIGVLFLNQFNEKGIQASQAGKRILPGYVEGGHSIDRNADYHVAGTMTEEQELANMFMLSTVKKRSAKGFWNVPFNRDLSVSIFRQFQQKAVR